SRARPILSLTGPSRLFFTSPRLPRRAAVTISPSAAPAVWQLPSSPRWQPVKVIATLATDLLALYSPLPDSALQVIDTPPLVVSLGSVSSLLCVVKPAFLSGLDPNAEYHSYFFSPPARVHEELA